MVLCALFGYLLAGKKCILISQEKIKLPEKLWHLFAKTAVLLGFSKTLQLQCCLKNIVDQRHSSPYLLVALIQEEAAWGFAFISSKIRNAFTACKPAGMKLSSTYKQRRPSPFPTMIWKTGISITSANKARMSWQKHKLYYIFAHSTIVYDNNPLSCICLYNKTIEYSYWGVLHRQPEHITWNMYIDDPVSPRTLWKQIIQPNALHELSRRGSNSAICAWLAAHLWPTRLCHSLFSSWFIANGVRLV